MIDSLIKFLLVCVLLTIFLQDVKERLVFWFLYPIVGILGYCIESNSIGYKMAMVNSLINLSFIIIVLFILYIYSKFKLKTEFVNGSMGLGDILLLIFLGFTFSTLPFFILFVFSLLFSLLLHLYFKDKSIHKDVPLAGYISLFFSSIYLASFFLPPKYLFS